jgi:outer membrane protein assembly factor BamB
MMTVLILLLCAQDWPGWRGTGHDGKLTGFQPPASWPRELQRGWQVEIGEGHATPALVDGRLYVHARQGEDEVTLCLDAATGKELWRDRTAVDGQFMLKSAAKFHGRGPFSSPAVADGRLFTFSIRGTLSCLEAKTGKVHWRNDFLDSFPMPYPIYGTAVSPFILDGACVVHVGGDKKGALVALDMAGGKTRWSWDGDGPGYATPILAVIGGTSQLITQTQSKAVGLAPGDGKLLWEVDYKTSWDENSVTPVVFETLVILSGRGNGIVAYRLDGEKPEPAWKTTEVSMYMSSPVVKGERLFGFSDTRKGQFFCLDVKNGKTLWTGEGRQGDNGALLDAGDVILALVTPRPDALESATLIVFDAGDKEYVERARYKVSETPAWAHPVVSGRSIFVKDRTKLTQWILR